MARRKTVAAGPRILNSYNSSLVKVLKLQDLIRSLLWFSRLTNRCKRGGLHSNLGGHDLLPRLFDQRRFGLPLGPHPRALCVVTLKGH